MISIVHICKIREEWRKNDSAGRYAAVPIRAVIAFASIVLTRSAPRNITTLLVAAVLVAQNLVLTLRPRHKDRESTDLAYKSR